MRIRIAPQARADLDGIWLYVAQETSNIDPATRLISSLTDKFALLARFPFIGRSLEPHQRPEIRILAAGNYLIFYSPKPGEVRILRIIHASRDAYAVFAGE